MATVMARLCDRCGCLLEQSMGRAVITLVENGEERTDQSVDSCLRCLATVMEPLLANAPPVRRWAGEPKP